MRALLEYMHQSGISVTGGHSSGVTWNCEGSSEGCASSILAVANSSRIVKKEAHHDQRGRPHPHPTSRGESPQGRGGTSAGSRRTADPVRVGGADAGGVAADRAGGVAGTDPRPGERA